jgi:hypothetical protein
MCELSHTCDSLFSQADRAKKNFSDFSVGEVINLFIELTLKWIAFERVFLDDVRIVINSEMSYLPCLLERWTLRRKKLDFAMFAESVPRHILVPRVLFLRISVPLLVRTVRNSIHIVYKAEDERIRFVHSLGYASNKSFFFE